MIPGAGTAEMTTAEVSQLMTKRAAEFQSLRGSGKVRIQSWEEKYRFSEVFVLESPTRFRLETIGFLDQPEVFLTSNDDILVLYTKKHNVAYRGVASQENLFKLSGINLSVEDTIQVLSGNPPRLSRANFEWGMFLKDLNSYYVERVSLLDDAVQQIWFDTTLRTISNIREYRLTNGELLLDIQFKDYRAATETYSLPAYILIDRPLDKTRVEITYKSFFEVNQPLDQTVFQFEPPKDAKIRYIEDTAQGEIERLAPYKEFQVEEK
jgi:outer membrane lipoprotein-sorting protein